MSADFTKSTANYPETLKAAFIINASKTVRLVFSVFKVTTFPTSLFISKYIQNKITQSTLDKIKVLGTSDWKKVGIKLKLKGTSLILIQRLISASP